MNTKSLTLTAALIASLAWSTALVAQEEHMIGGKTVPVDQVTEVQAKCDELRKAEPAKDAASATEATTTEQAGSTAVPASTTAGWTEDGGTIDIDKLTVALCDEGNFTAPAM